MTSVSKFLFGREEPNDRLRYAERVHGKPVVVWNVTPACNLACAHCYASASSGQNRRDAVLDGAQARSVIDDLAAWAKKQGITYKQLKDFNPWLRSRTLPDKSGKLYKVLIPIKEDMYYNNKRQYVTYDKNWVVE